MKKGFKTVFSHISIEITSPFCAKSIPWISSTLKVSVNIPSPLKIMLQIYSIYFCTLKVRKSSYLLWVVFTKNEKTITDDNENPFSVCYKALNVICHFSLSKSWLMTFMYFQSYWPLNIFGKTKKKSQINFYYNWDVVNFESVTCNKN